MRRSRDSLLATGAAPAKEAAGYHPGACHVHQHCAEEHHRLAARHAANPARLFGAGMTAEEMALVLEAAQALVDPPERFSTKTRSGSGHAKYGPAFYDRYVFLYFYILTF
jgi:hypothetical protein